MQPSQRLELQAMRTQTTEPAAAWYKCFTVRALQRSIAPRLCLITTISGRLVNTNLAAPS